MAKSSLIHLKPLNLSSSSSAWASLQSCVFAKSSYQSHYNYPSCIDFPAFNATKRFVIRSCLPQIPDVRHDIPRFLLLSHRVEISKQYGGIFNASILESITPHNFSKYAYFQLRTKKSLYSINVIFGAEQQVMFFDMNLFERNVVLKCILDATEMTAQLIIIDFWFL